MKKIGLKPNGWFPFVKTAVPFTLLYAGISVLTEQRPFAETWIRIIITSVFCGVGFWAVSSWWVRRRSKRV